jgi:hypothetical protein
MGRRIKLRPFATAADQFCALVVPTSATSDDVASVWTPTGGRLHSWTLQEALSLRRLVSAVKGLDCRDPELLPFSFVAEIY